MNQNKKTAWATIMVVLGMFAISYAAFPLYTLFCKATGYGGTPKTYAKQTTTYGKKHFIVRFNTDISPGLSWNFSPVEKQVEVLTGENKLVFFTAQNLSNKTITGVATYNISPDEAGQYFNKVQCFCFNKQTLKPGEKVQMPVSFYIDPKIETDPDVKDINTVTLSYTFFVANK